MKGFVYDTKHFEVYEHINSNDETEWQVVRYRTGGSASDMNRLVLFMGGLQLKK